MLTSYKLWKNICLRNDLPLGKLKYFWGGGGHILLTKIKIKCTAGQNLEIMTFRYLKTLQNYLMFLFLKSIVNYN